MSFQRVCFALVVAAAAGAANADVRVIHASPDAPPVDIYVNTVPGMGPPAISNLAFTQGTPFVPFPTGLYNIQVTPAGLPAPVVINITAPVDGSLNYTVAATGFMNDLQPSVYLDDLTSVANAARIRFIHAAPDADALDIFASGSPNPIFDSIFFRSSSAYAQLPGGTYDLEGRYDANGNTALTAPGLTFQNGYVYTIFAMGSADAGNLRLVTFVDAIPAPGTGAAVVLAGLVTLRRRR
jgi:hypothetical protein